MGKTHLLMAIGHAVRAVAPAATIEYVTLDEFVEAFATAVAAGQAEGYRRRYTELDVLLVDDVQFLAGRREMQAELLEWLRARGTSVVLSPTKPARRLIANTCCMCSFWRSSMKYRMRSACRTCDRWRAAARSVVA